MLKEINCAENKYKDYISVSKLINAAATLTEKENILKGLSDDVLNELANKVYQMSRYIAADVQRTREKVLDYIMVTIWRQLKSDLNWLTKKSDIINFVKKNNLTADEFYRVSGLYYLYSECKDSSIDEMINLYVEAIS